MTDPILEAAPADSVALRLPHPDAPTDPPPVTCAHCGLEVPAGLVDASAPRHFCCAGCQTAFTLLSEGGLDRYYELPERRDRPVVATGRSFEEFDHPAFHELYVNAAGPLSRVELYLEGVHCASCVWLVERVPLIMPGVARAELDIRRALATIEWDERTVQLSRIARMLDSLGYTPHPFRGARRDEIRRREDRRALAGIGVAGALAANVMLAALALYSGWANGMEASFARFFRWVSLLLTAPALLGPGRVFFTSAWAAVRTRALHMDLPIAIALGAGVVRGAINTITDAGPVYFDGVAMLVFLLLAGRYLQRRGQRAAADAAELLYSLTPSSANVIAPDGSVQAVPAQALVPGHLLLVQSGETLAADGIVEGGQSTVDLSLLTGESKPVRVERGAAVYAGTLNVAAPLRVRVTVTGEESRLARLMRQVEDSARRRAPVVMLADRMAGWFTATVITLAVAAWIVWLPRDPSQAVDIAIALLVVTCPCALALATPLAISTAIGRAARAGIYIKGGAALEALARPCPLFLDKTGTLTTGRTSLVRWDGPDWVKPLVLSLERESTHPIALAFPTAFGEQPALAPTWSRHVVGGGIEGVVGAHHVVIGSPRFVASSLAGADDMSGEAREQPSPATGSLRRDDVMAPALPLQPEGTDGILTPVWVAVDGHLVATAGLGDAIRPEASRILADLRKRGWRLRILSGDDPRVVRAVGQRLGFAPDECEGGLSPEDKLQRVEAARRDGPVVMVGDGVNDAAAMAAASAGIGVHGGAEACLATADVYLTRSGLASLAQLTDGARRTLAIIRRGIVFSLGYNVVGATLALLGVITPLIAAVLMPASSLTVLVAAWRGRSFDREVP